MWKLLVITFLSVNFINCQPISMEANFIELTKGLNDEHLESIPLLELVNCPPDSEVCSTLRIYEDGSLYYLSEKNEISDAQWGYITKIKQKGIELLKPIFRKYCNNLSSEINDASSQGLNVYRFSSDDCTREIKISGVQFKNFEKLSELNSIINSNLVPLE